MIVRVLFEECAILLLLAYLMHSCFLRKKNISVYESILKKTQIRDLMSEVIFNKYLRVAIYL